MFEFLIKKLKAHPRKIVFTEGTDPRILEASARLLSGTFLTPVLVGNLDEIQAAAEEAGFNIRGAEIIDPEAFPDMEKMVSTLVELRKGKMSEEECRKLLKQANYFGTMLVKMGYADALLGGATYSTADTVRPALQIIKTKPGNKIVSSCFILVRPDGQSPGAGGCGRLCFPDINAGNIGYKIAQRLGSFEAYGPILQGLNAPINDLSRGCNAQEVYSMAIITAGLCED